MTDDDSRPEVQTIRVGDDQGRGGLYNTLIPGGFERADLLLPLVGINPETGPAFRLRDAWVETSPLTGLALHVYTRVGGNNRADYTAVINQLRDLPTYLRDDDDSFDSTYASFWFRIPEVYAAELKDVASAPIDTGQRWRVLIDRLGGNR